MYRLEESKHFGEAKLLLDEGFIFTPRLSSEYGIEEVTIYDNKLISWFIYNRFMKKYKKLVAMVIEILQDDNSSDADTRLALDEVAKQKQIMVIKYQKYLKEKELLEYEKKLEYLEKELKNKFLVSYLAQKANYGYPEYKEEKGKSR
jgi:hypothetical protein